MVHTLSMPINVSINYEPAIVTEVVQVQLLEPLLGHLQKIKRENVNPTEIFNKESPGILC